MSVSLPDRKVLDWLGIDSRGVPYYLNPLNLVWSDEGVEHDLAVFRGVAERLALDMPYWAEIIRSGSWRHCLAGCTCLLVSSRREFFDDLCFGFRQGSFVAPQISVTLGLLHGSAARPFFESVLGDPALRNRPKESASAYEVLLRLGAQPTHETLNPGTDLDQGDAMVAEQVVAEHWDFWSERVK